MSDVNKNSATKKVIALVIIAALTMSLMVALQQIAAFEVLAEYAAPSCNVNDIFGPQQIISESVINTHSVYAADLNGDRYLDVIATSQGNNAITWYENRLNESLPFTFTLPVTITIADPYSIIATDIDNDGHQDLVAASGWPDEIVWYENKDGKGSFGSRQVINDPDNVSAFFVTAADLDGDDDTDILAAHQGDPGNFWERSKIAWYENDLNITLSWITHTISADVGRALSVFAADLDGDNDLDFLAALADDNKIAWYENLDGEGTFGDQNIIVADAYAATSVAASNVDGDEDIDVFSTSSDDHTIAWHENWAGNGSIWSKYTISESPIITQPIKVISGDIDRDSDTDIVVSSYYVDNPSIDSKITVYLNDGHGVFCLAETIVQEPDVIALNDIHLADLDNDGFLDVLSASGDDNKIAWYENKLFSNYLPVVLNNFIDCLEGPYEEETNNIFADANGSLCSGKDYFGYPNDTYDVFYFVSMGEGQVSIDLQNHTGVNTQLQLYDAEKYRLAYDPTPPFNIDYPVSEGLYYIVIYTEPGFNNEDVYTLRVIYPVAP